MSVFDIKEYIDQNRIHSIEYGFGDINGTIRGKIVTARHFLQNVEASTDLARAPFAWDLQCGVYDDIEYANFENGFPDIKAKPIVETLREIPWRKGTAFVLCDAVDKQGNPVELSPRVILQKVIDQAHSLGYRLQTGCEMEFYLLDGSKKPLFGGVQCYSVNKSAEIDDLLGNVRNSLEAFGIKIEATHVEYGPAQIEIIPEFTDPLTLADSALLIKAAVKQIARKAGLYASFMPKIWENESGSGFHIHQSLWNDDLTVNLFENNQTLADQYLAGLVHFAPDFFALGSPSVNAYKRLQENSFAPTTANWGEDNRTVAVRTLFGLGKASRIEYRIASSDCNPYLVIAASIISGIYGIKHGLRVEGTAKPLPRSIREAVAALEANPESAAFFGGDFIKNFGILGRHEAELYEKTITDWELQRYFEEA